VHKTFVDIIPIVYSTAELVHKTQRL